MRTRALIGGTVFAGGALLAVAAVQASSVPLGLLALLCATAFLTELVIVPGDESSVDPRDTTTLTFSGGIHIAAALVLGPWAAAVVAAFGVVTADGLRRRPARQIAFNASTSAIAAALGGFVFQALGGTPGALDVPGTFPALAALALVVYGVGAVLVSTVVAFEGGMPLAATVREGFVGGLSASVGEASLGLALAFFLLVEPWASVALVPLVFAVYRSYERLVALRRETAHALETFANVIDERDSYTYHHSARVAEYVRALADALGLPARTVAQLRWAGRLHDLGKLSVDSAVLGKPGKLDEAEWEAMRLHPRLSARLLRRFHLARDQAKAVEYHHERADGGGYYGIREADIPLAAHFLIVADSYDAMTSDRAYRAGLAPEVALEEIERNIGRQFHPIIAKAFVAQQRGDDPLQALTPAERAELRTVTGFLPGRAVGRVLTLRSELIVGAGVLAALAALGTGRLGLLVPAGLAIAGGTARQALEHVRARRLAARLATVLAADLPPGRVFALVAGQFARASELRWAGVVSWREREVTGSIELEWNGGTEAPSETALTSWLLREADTGTGLLVAAGAELGRDDRHVALALRRNGGVTGYLVLAVAGRRSRLVERVLSASADALAASLLADPEASVPRPRLQAVGL